MRTNKQILVALRHGPRQEGYNDIKLSLSEEERDSFYEFLESHPAFTGDSSLFESKREVIRFDCDWTDGGEVPFVIWDKREPMPPSAGYSPAALRYFWNNTSNV